MKHSNELLKKIAWFDRYILIYFVQSYNQSRRIEIEGAASRSKNSDTMHNKNLHVRLYWLWNSTWVIGLLYPIPPFF